MQPVQFNTGIIYNPVLQGNNLSSLVKERDELDADKKIVFIKNHPEIMGLKVHGTTTIFDGNQFVEDLKVFEPKSHEDELNLMTKYSPISEVKRLIEICYRNNQYDEIIKFAPERSSLLNDISFELSKQNGPSPSCDQVLKIISVLPHLNWYEMLWNGPPGGRAATSYMFENIGEPGRDELYVFASLSGKIDSHHGYTDSLFLPLFEVFHKSAWRGLSGDLKNLIIADVFHSTYPVLKIAPKIWHFFNHYCREKQDNFNKKPALLAFQEYRDNNGNPHYSKSQKSDIIRLFQDCLVKKPLLLGLASRKAFIKEIGKNRLTKSDIKHALSKVVYLNEPVKSQKVIALK